jgi:CubicO group peptidase (beta-lactamase class C family)
MKDTSLALPKDQLDRCVPVLRHEEDGSFTLTDLDYPQAPEFYTGGGCVYTSAPDFLLLERALLRGGSLEASRILKPHSVEEMFRSQTGPLDIEVLRSAVPSLSKDVDLGPGRKWGLGLCLASTTAAEGSPGCGGWAGIFNTYFWIDPVSGLAAALYMQYVPFFDEVATSLVSEFERAVYARFRPERPDGGFGWRLRGATKRRVHRGC